MAGSRRARADITPELRGGLKRAIKIMEADGRPLSTIWVELFDKDPVNAMRLAISMMPKEMDITQTTLSPEDWLEMMADAAGKSESTTAADIVQGPVH